MFFFFSSRRRHTRLTCDWSSDVCSSDLGGGPGIYPELALGTRNSVDGRLRREIAVEADGAAGIVVSGHHVADAVGVTVGIDHGGDRQTEPPRLLDRDVLFVGVNHEQQVGKAAHVLDPAERTIELIALALQREALLLGVAHALP